MSDKPRVLIVDDEEVILLSIRKVLKKDDYEIDTVLSGDEAVAKLSAAEYDVVITDLMMPGMSGMDLLEKMGKMGLGARAIMVTGYATMKTAMQAMQKGAFDYVAKPFTKDELRSVVLRAVRSAPTNTAEMEVPHGTPKSAEDPLSPGRIYSLRNHTWLRIEDDRTVTVGLAPTLVASTGSLLSMELPQVGEYATQGKVCVRLIAEDARIHAVWSPVTGKVLAVNQDVLDHPRLPCEDPMGRGWLMKIEPSGLAGDVENLI